MALFAMFFMYILFWNSKGENEEKRLVMPDEFDVYKEFQELKKNFTLFKLDVRNQLSASKGMMKCTI